MSVLHTKITKYMNMTTSNGSFTFLMTMVDLVLYKVTPESSCNPPFHLQAFLKRDIFSVIL